MIRTAAAAPKARPVVYAERPKPAPSLMQSKTVAYRLGEKGFIGHQVEVDTWFTLEMIDWYGLISSRDGYLALRSIQFPKEVDPGLLLLDNFGIHVTIRIERVGD